MLDVRESWTFSFGLSTREGKLGLVELCGEGSAREGDSPEINFNINSIRTNLDYFVYEGKINGKSCSFKVDTGSDVSIVNSRIVDKRISVSKESINLKYPTGERVPVKFQIEVRVELGRFSLDMPMIVADISDECLLGVDFLKMINLEKVFDPAFKVSEFEGKVARIEKSSERVPISLKELFDNNSKKLNNSERKDFIEFLRDFENVFSEEIVAGNCNSVEHVINVQDSLPIKQVPRRIPIHMREEVDKNIEEMRTRGVIEESQSPWVSPAVLVRKKDGTIRFCVDFRKLNAVTIKDSYPLPRIDDILDQLAGNCWFSTLDLKSGYWQIKIRPEDREKTAFSIGKGLWQFTVMPFGLCNAPATFERLMEKVLQNLISKICLVYLDDVIIFGKTFADMISNLKIVFSRLRDANLKINPKKCTFFENNVKYLGHVISSEGITTNPEKIIAVQDWPVPHTRKQLRSFLGFCSYYRKFVKGFSSLAKPLYALTENKAKFLWEAKCQEAFEKLKLLLSSSPILSFPKEQGEFILDTDASNIGIGAVLSQKQDDEERVIAYFSRVLSKSERNYCVTRRELLSIVDSIKFFRHYLLGRKFLIRTDHVSLRWLMSFRDLEGQLARWLERLQQYEFEIVYRKGLVHRNADGLSRRLCESIDCGYCSAVERKNAANIRKTVARIVLEGEDLKEWYKAQREDPDILFVLQGKEAGMRPPRSEIPVGSVSAQIYWAYWDSLIIKEGILYKKWEAPNLRSSFLQLVVPRSRVKEILEETHDSPSGGHFGINKTLEKIRKRFFWATCKQDVEEWCRTCRTCVSKKSPLGKGKSPLQIYNVGSPLERIQMDILGPLPLTTLGNKYLLVLVDCFTKWVEAFPVKNIRAKTIAEVFVSQFVSRHGVPIEIHTDQGKNFESRLFSELMRLLGIRKTRTTALHPQSNGQVERQHQTIVNYLAKYVAENQKDWDQWVPMFLLAYRSSKQETTGVTPAELYFARELRLPVDLLQRNPNFEEERLPPGRNFVEKLRDKLEEIHSNVRERMDLKSAQMKARYDRKAREILFQEGERVWLFNPRRSRGKAQKLQSNWEGPYLIIKKLSDVVYCVQKTPRHKKKIVHADRLASFLERALDKINRSPDII